jgi:hypothetical protein
MLFLAPKFRMTDMTPITPGQDIPIVAKLHERALVLDEHELTSLKSSKRESSDVKTQHLRIRVWWCA